jgi:bifunctional DNA-binding transcriptional regulator/antitoxin component of YhaV-PrlF toxin-antitoxin module
MENVIKLSRDGQVKLSSDLRRVLGLRNGEYLHVKVVGHSLVLTPQKLIDQDQAYFWSEEWQAAERAAQQDIDAGRIETFSTVDELVRDLNS